jgi:hypothetical protein
MELIRIEYQKEIGTAKTGNAEERHRVTVAAIYDDPIIGSGNILTRTEYFNTKVLAKQYMATVFNQTT